MAENEKHVGEIAWVDLTVGDAAAIRATFALFQYAESQT
jgi:hypothetical protein